jgi:sugar phosphate isomerase/epimerase
LAPAAAEAGFDFLEWTVGALLRPREDEDAFAAALASVKQAPLPCPIVNCFIPGNLKITGPAADLAALRAYATTAFRRAERAGVSVIVFGSGGARQVPPETPMARATDQVVEFCRMLGPLADAHGVTVAVEPLNRTECNILTTVAEAAAVVRAVGHPRVRLLVDAYHWGKDGDSLAGIGQNGDLLVHAHIATIAKRLCPGDEACDFGPFFAAMKQARYTGTLSVESICPNLVAHLPLAVQTLRALTA